MVDRITSGEGIIGESGGEGGRVMCELIVDLSELMFCSYVLCMFMYSSNRCSTYVVMDDNELVYKGRKQKQKWYVTYRC